MISIVILSLSLISSVNSLPDCVGVSKTVCGFYACVALMTDGNAVAWGDNANGGDASSVDLTNVADISCSNKACVARKNDGTAVAWGDDDYGGDKEYVATFTDVVDISCMFRGRVCVARMENGTIKAWGDTERGGTLPDNLVDLIDFADVLCSEYFCVARMNNGSAYTWGRSSGYGAMGLVPSDLNDVIDISCGSYACVAIKKGGIVRAWGHATYSGTAPPLTDVVDVSCGQFACAARMENGTAVTWGHWGGDTTCDSHSTGCTALPAGVTLTNVADITCSGYSCAALMTNGNAYAWGYSRSGGSFNCQTLSGESVDYCLPAGVDLTEVVAISCGFATCVVIKKDGKVYSWGGSNNWDTTIHSNLMDVVDVSCGGAACVAIMGDGSAAAWGGPGRGGALPIMTDWETGTGAPTMTSSSAVPIGSYKNLDWKLDRSKSLCVECPVGTYQDQPNKETCKDCPPGESTLSPGSITEECFTALEIKQKFLEKRDPTLVPAYNVANSCV
jgi:alpha-tubulin suppressor-like RCC1 family protein